MISKSNLEKEKKNTRMLKFCAVTSSVLCFIWKRNVIDIVAGNVGRVESQTVEGNWGNHKSRVNSIKTTQWKQAMMKKNKWFHISSRYRKTTMTTKLYRVRVILKMNARDGCDVNIHFFPSHKRLTEFEFNHMRDLTYYRKYKIKYSLGSLALAHISLSDLSHFNCCVNRQKVILNGRIEWPSDDKLCHIIIKCGSKSFSY